MKYYMTDSDVIVNCENCEFSRQEGDNLYCAYSPQDPLYGQQLQVGADYWCSNHPFITTGAAQLVTELGILNMHEVTERLRRDASGWTSSVSRWEAKE